MDFIDSEEAYTTITNSGEFGSLVIMPEENNLLIQNDVPQNTGTEEPTTPNTNLYHQEWERLFMNKENFTHLQDIGLKGNLRSCRFRSICWRIFLECFSDSPSEWPNKVRSTRENYIELKKKFETDPWKKDPENNLGINNPLSQEEKSDWNRYFQDIELRLTIQQDVNRTFPEIEFFHTPQIQTMMTNILFCYAKHNPRLSYRQGMHELLAPILFVLFSDQQSFLHASELTLVNEFDPISREIIEVIFDPEYSEHDAFYLFSQLMEAVEPWYINFDGPSPTYKNQFMMSPFSNSADNGCFSHIGVKLQKIYQHQLKRSDIKLFSHLENLEISPQFYGIRWLRLLFGREFAMQDLLVIWDAIFSSGFSLDLVDYIFTAMLIYIRQLLLPGDYASCLHHLMRYPAVVDVHCIIGLALHLKDPNKNSLNISNSFGLFQLPQSVLRNLDFNKSSQEETTKKKEMLISTLKRKMHVSRPKTLLPSPTMSQPSSSDMSSASSASSPTPGILKDAAIHGSPQHKDLISYHRSFSTSLRQIGSTTPKVPIKEMKAIKQGLLEKASPENMKSEYCHKKLSLLIGQLQTCLTNQDLQDEDEIFLALAGLKHVRDVLKGVVNFEPDLENLQAFDDNDGVLSFSKIGIEMKEELNIKKSAQNNNSS